MMSSTKSISRTSAEPLRMFRSPGPEIRSISNTPLKETSSIVSPIFANNQMSSTYRPFLKDYPINRAIVSGISNPPHYVSKLNYYSDLAPLSRSMSVVHLNTSVVDSGISVQNFGTNPGLVLIQADAQETKNPPKVTIYGRKSSTPQTLVSTVHLENRASRIESEEPKLLDRQNVKQQPVQAANNQELVEALSLIRELMEQNRQLMTDGLKFKEELESKAAEYTELWREIQQIKSELDTVKHKNVKETSSPSGSVTEQVAGEKVLKSVGPGAPTASKVSLPEDQNKVRLQSLVQMFRGLLSPVTPRQVTIQSAKPPLHTPQTPVFQQKQLLEPPQEDPQSEVLVRDLLQVSQAGVSEAWLDPRDLVSSREYTQEDWCHGRQNSSWTEARASEQIAFMDSKFGGSQLADPPTSEPLLASAVPVSEIVSTKQETQLPQTHLFQLRADTGEQSPSPKERIKPTKSKLLKIIAQQPPANVASQQKLEKKDTELKQLQLNLPLSGSIKPLKKLSSRESVSSKPGNTAENSTVAGNSASPVAKGSRLFNPREVRYPGQSTVPELVFNYKTHGTSAIKIVESVPKMSATSTSPTNRGGRVLGRSNSNKAAK